MPSYSNRSMSRLLTCDLKIVHVFERVIEIADNTILVGHRSEAEQNEAFDTGRSKLKWPDSDHNSQPSQAVDAAPYPIDWNDRERATYFAGLVQGVARSMGVRFRWGGDWNGDWQVRDNVFDDLWHFGLRE